MDLARYAVNAVTIEGRSIRQVAAATGRSKSWVHRHVALYRAGGEAALAPRKRGPKAVANRTAAATEDAIVALRKELDDQGFDAGARTIHYHLTRRGGPCPSERTIHRVLTRRGFVTAQPHKRPRNSWIRFESSLANETWQSDMTHWKLGREQVVTHQVEVLNFVDDYSRAVMASVVVPVATAPLALAAFQVATDRYGLPASLLSDNGCIFTTEYRGGHTALEIALRALHIAFKHGRPYHPQTQGKVERYHLTLKKWLKKQPLVATIAELQTQIDSFVLYYNEERPHQARGCPPMHAWRARDKDRPRIDGVLIPALTKVRHDKVDKSGAVTLRYQSRLHHLSIGRMHRGKPVLILVADRDVRVLDNDGITLRHLTLDPSIDYQPRRLDTV
jgi:transposase InsO family protein